MTKRLAKTADVAHAWANQTQSGGRAASASFDGLSLISWRTRIAVLIPHRHGMGGQFVALVSSFNYSKSTAVVIGQARTEANKAGHPVFLVEHVDTIHHVQNLRAYEGRVGASLEKIERARKPDQYRQEARDLISEAYRYSSVFSLGWTYQGPPPETVLSKLEREAKS